MGILVKPLVMAIWAIYGQNGQNGDCFTILGQIYIVKMAIFDQFYQHRKELSYRDFKGIFGNGMA